MRKIPINKNRLPYRIRIPIDVATFTMEFQYNAETDSFTVSLELEGEIIIQGEPILLANPLFFDFPHLPTPPALIIPLSTTPETERIGWAELGNEVSVYLIGGEE